MQKSRAIRPNTTKLLLIAAVFFALFICVAILVFSGQTHAVDMQLILFLHPLASIVPPFLIWGLTFWGAPGDYLIAILLALYLIAKRRKIDVIALAMCLLGSEIQLEIIKLIFHRPRPSIFQETANMLTYSFPSGHAQTSIAFYGFIAYLFTKNISINKNEKILIRSALLLFAFLIGLSRIVEGVHWPTDVLGGFLYGIAWLFICLSVLSYLHTNLHTKSAD